MNGLMNCRNCFFKFGYGYKYMKMNLTRTQASSSISEKLRTKFLKFGGGSVSLSKSNNGGIAEVYFNYEEKKNAFTGKMMIELADIVSELKTWKEGKSLILHSPGDVFCSGADLSMVKQIATSKEGLEMATIMHDALTRLRNLPLISVALIKGKAIGGGAELATSCDFRLLTPDAVLQFVQVKMGVVTGWGGGTRLCYLVNPSVALRLLITGAKITATECLQLGLANAILESDNPLLESKDWLLKHTRGSSHVLQCVKQIISNSTTLTFENALLEERKLFSSVWGGEAQLKVLEKIFEK